MKTFRDFWSFSAIRGAMTILACGVMLLIPYFAQAILPLPLMLAFAIDCLAAYCLLDAVAVLLMGLVLPMRDRGDEAIFLQVAAGVLFGSLFFAVTYGEFRPYLMWLLAGQAAIAAGVQLAVADRTHAEYRSLWCYAPAALLAACALALPFAGGLDTEAQLVAMAGYVGLYGATQLALSARMLFVEYRAEHPAHVEAHAWRLLMHQPTPEDRFHAEPLGRPYVVPGHGGRMVPAHSRAA